MKFSLRQFSPARILGFGLGITFLYAGVCSFADPTPWLGYMPAWVESLLPLEQFAIAHGVFQVLLGAALLVGVLPKFASAVATLDLAAILVFYGIDLVTFRDIGLFFATLAFVALNIGKYSPAPNE
ncbi:MAG: DoxX family membrane protein [Candidatus Brennerbacteria bacterium]